MANFMKIDKTHTILQLKHNERTLKEGTDSIDYSLTNNNTSYNSAGCKSLESNIETYKSIISGVKMLNRGNVKPLIECVVTLPVDVKKEDKDKFWTATIDFFRKRYGSNSFVGAYIHKDEPGAREHMHIDFVPLVKNLIKDKEEQNKLNKQKEEELKQLEENAKKADMTVNELEKAKCEIKKRYKLLSKTVKKVQSGYKVSAKDILTKEELKMFHPLLSEHIKRALGYEVSILNGRTKTNEVRKTRNEYKYEKEKRHSKNVQTVLLYYASAYIRVKTLEAQRNGIKDDTEIKKYIYADAKKHANEYKATPPEYKVIDVEKLAEGYANYEENKYLESFKKQNKERKGMER